MPTVRVYLRTDTKGTQGKYPLVLEYQDRGAKRKFPLGHSIEPKHWNTKSRTVSSKHPESDAINHTIQLYLTTIQSLLHELKSQGQYPTPDQVAQLFRRRLGHEQPPTQAIQSTSQLIQTFIDRKTATQAPESIKQYRALLVDLNTFQHQLGHTIIPASFNADLFEQFRLYLVNKGLATNTISKKISYIKTIFNWAEATFDGLTIHPAYRNQSSPRKPNTRVDFSLTMEEVQKLYRADLAHSPRLQRIRDIFLFAIHCGLRYSDLLQLTPAHVQDGRIHYTSQKTRKADVIPITPTMPAIIQRYSGHHNPKGQPRLLPLPANAVYNRYLKELAEHIGLNRQVKQDQNSRGPVNSQFVPLHQVISTHAARRTNINLYLAESQNPYLAAQHAGHASFSVTAAYVQPSKERAHQEAAELLERITQAG